MRAFAVCAGLLLLSVAAQATVLIPIEFRELVATSSAIVHGRVTDARSVFVDERRSVDTFVTVAVEDYLKGNLGEYVTFRVPGGEAGRYRTVFVGAPQFARGDEVVLFLKATSGRVPVVVGLSQGVFRVLPEPGSGRRLVTTPVVMSRKGEMPQRVIRGDPARRPISIETFSDAVRQVMAEGAVR